MTDSCTKRCGRCGTEKSLDEFGNDRSRTDGKFPYCKVCNNEASREWKRQHRARSPEEAEERRLAANERARIMREHDLNRHDKQLLKRYGADLGTFDLLMVLQNGRCAICGALPGEVDGARRLHLDHNHETGKIRGLLCMLCNQGLGRFRDDVSLLQAAIDYLQQECGLDLTP